MRIARQYYPENPDILATLLDAYLSGRQLEEAQKLIDETGNILQKMKNPKFLRNTGVFYLQTEQFELLGELLGSLLFNEDELSSEIKEEVRYMNGLLALQGKEYAKAVDLLAGFGDMNSVQALLGAKKLAEAWQLAKSYPCVKAREYYIQAIAAAYAGEKVSAGDALAKAVALDVSLYEKMKKEYAFKEMEDYLPIHVSE